MPRNRMFLPLLSVSAAISLKPTPIDKIPQIVSRVSSKSDEWRCTPLDDKIHILRTILSNTIEHQEEWNTLAQRSRGVDSSDERHGSARADIIVSGPATFGSYLNGLIATLEHRREYGKPPPPKSVRRIGGRSVVRVWPRSLLDRLEAVGLEGELVLGDIHARQTPYEETCVGGVCGILGAGNFDAPIELLCEMFLKGRSVVYKPNPVNEQKHEAVAKILAPLVSKGFLDFVIGGAEVGSTLVQDPMLEEVVLTGSIATYDKIRAITDTPITAELGGVNPWIVVPGEQWNRRSVDRHARHLAFARVSNNGHVCAAPQIFIVQKDWEWRGVFMERLRYWLGEYAGAPPFYPGSAETYLEFRGLPGAEVMEGDDAFENQQRPILLTNLSVDDERVGSVFTREAFCPVLAEVPIEDGSDDPMEFLRMASHFAQQKCFGSLAANILIPDKIILKNSEEFDALLAELPYGLVGVNIWPTLAHSMPSLVWGAAPGHPRSGIGFIGNAGNYEFPEKTILRAPFHWLGRRALSVMPPGKNEKVFRRLARYKLRPGLWTQTMLFMALFVGV